MMSHRPVCFVFERARAPRHLTRGMEAIASVASVKYQLWSHSQKAPTLRPKETNLWSIDVVLCEYKCARE